MTEIRMNRNLSAVIMTKNAVVLCVSCHNSGQLIDCPKKDHHPVKAACSVTVLDLSSIRTQTTATLIAWYNAALAIEPALDDRNDPVFCTTLTTT